MLSKPHNQAYQEFSTLLQKLQDDFVSMKETSSVQDKSDFDLNNTEISIVSIKEQFQRLQTFFQQQIVPLTSQELDETIAIRWQSLQTEVHREFRLLNTDMLFLASSKQAKTKSQRLQSLCDRLDKIIGYCTAINSL